MSKYEITFLLNEEKELKNLEDLITSFAGKILKKDAWGEKNLAYPIKKQFKAHFYLWSFEMDKSKLTELKRKLNFNEVLLRHLVLEVDH